MKNITLAVDDEVLAEVRRYATDNNTTVNGIVRDYLKSIAATTKDDAAARARKRLVELSNRSEASLGDWKWNRDEVYDRRVFTRHEHSDLRGFHEDGGDAEKETGE